MNFETMEFDRLHWFQDMGLNVQKYQNNKVLDYDFGTLGTNLTTLTYILGMKLKKKHPMYNHNSPNDTLNSNLKSMLPFPMHIY